MYAKIVKINEHLKMPRGSIKTKNKNLVKQYTSCIQKSKQISCNKKQIASQQVC